MNETLKMFCLLSIASSSFMTAVSLNAIERVIKQAKIEIQTTKIKPMYNEQTKQQEKQVIERLMEIFEVDYPEAQRRLALLFESGILHGGAKSLEQKDVQFQASFLLALPSEESTKLVKLEKAVTQCMNDRAFVHVYSQITKTDFAKTVQAIAKGEKSDELVEQFAKFTHFVKVNVVDAAEKQSAAHPN